MARGVPLLVAVALVAAACGGADEPSRPPFDGRLAEVLRDPAAFEDRRVRLQAFYHEAFGTSVLTTGFVEDEYPPTPLPPTVWISAPEPDGCLRSDIGYTWGRVVAEGIFRHDDRARFGPFGVWPMEVQDARLRCP